LIRKPHKRNFPWRTGGFDIRVHLWLASFLRNDSASGEFDSDLGVLGVVAVQIFFASSRYQPSAFISFVSHFVVDSDTGGIQ
jgi:hypothetical protein